MPASHASQPQFGQFGQIPHDFPRLQHDGRRPGRRAPNAAHHESQSRELRVGLVAYFDLAGHGR